MKVIKNILMSCLLLAQGMNFGAEAPEVEVPANLPGEVTLVCYNKNRRKDMQQMLVDGVMKMVPSGRFYREENGRIEHVSLADLNTTFDVFEEALEESRMLLRDFECDVSVLQRVLFDYGISGVTDPDPTGPAVYGDEYDRVVALLRPKTEKKSNEQEPIEVVEVDQRKALLDKLPDEVTLKCTDGIIPNVSVPLLVNNFEYFDAYFRNWGSGRFAYTGEEVIVDGTVKDMDFLLSFVGDPFSYQWGGALFSYRGGRIDHHLSFLKLANQLCMKKEKMNLKDSDKEYRDLIIGKELHTTSAYEKFLEGDFSDYLFATDFMSRPVFEVFHSMQEVPHDFIVGISPDGHYGVVKSDDGYQVIDRNLAVKKVLFSIPSTCDVVKFSPDSKLLWIGKMRGEGQLWDIESKERLLRSDRGFSEVRFSPDSKWMIIENTSGFNELWNVATRTEQRFDASIVYKDTVGAGAIFSADSSLLGFPVNGGAKIFNLVSGEDTEIITLDKIVVVGDASNVFDLARYNSNGSLDSSFGANGRVTTSLGGASSYATSALIQANGKIIAVGVVNTGDHELFALVRYNTNGTTDTSFGTSNNGVVTIDPTGDNAGAYTALLQPDGKIIAAGYSQQDGHNKFALVRYTTNGIPDTTFGNGTGIVTTDMTPGGDSYINAILLQPDGKIIALGCGNNGVHYIALARYNSNGSLDTTFGNGTGSVIISTNILPYAALLQPDGKIIALGYGNNGINSIAALARYNSDGTIDTSFGNGTGIVATDMTPGGDSLINAAVLQSDGKIVAGGYGNNGVNAVFAVVRYNSDGSLDVAFGVGGITVTDTTIGTVSQANAAFLQSGSKPKNISFSLDGKRMGCVGERGGVELYDVKTNECILKLSNALDFSFTSDESVLLVQKGIDTFVFYDLKTKQEVPIPKTFVPCHKLVGCSPDKRAFIFYSNGRNDGWCKNKYLFTTLTMDVSVDLGFGDPSRSFFGFAFNVDSSLMAIQLKKNHIQVFETTTGHLIFSIGIEGMEGMPRGAVDIAIKNVAFGSNGKFLIVEYSLIGQDITRSFVINLPLEKAGLDLSDEERYLYRALKSRGGYNKLSTLGLPEELETMFDRLPRALQDEILTPEGRVKRDLVRDVEGVYGRVRTMFGVDKQKLQPLNEEQCLYQTLKSRVQEAGHKLDTLSLPVELDDMFDRLPYALQNEILTPEGSIKRGIVKMEKILEQYETAGTITNTDTAKVETPWHEQVD